MMYLTEIDSNVREDESVDRLLGSPLMREEFLNPLGLPSFFWWAMTNVAHQRLVNGFRGDVDVVMGPVKFSDAETYWLRVEQHRKQHPGFHEGMYQWIAAHEFAAQGGLVWPPCLDYLVALETKCTRYTPQQQPTRSNTAHQPEQRRVEGQVGRLTMMGFNRVILLDLIANPPIGGGDGQAWLNAAGMSLHSQQELLSKLQRRFQNVEAGAGHAVVSWGAVSGGDESSRGAGCPQWVRLPAHNPRLAEPRTREYRLELEGNLRELLARVSHPRMFPVIIPSPTGGAP